MEWEIKGVRFAIEVEALGPFSLATARAPAVGGCVRVRPFSALGRSEPEALEFLRRQIELEYRKVPAPDGEIAAG